MESFDTKPESFKNAVQSGFFQTRIILKRIVLLGTVETEAFENGVIQSKKKELKTKDMSTDKN